MPKSFTVNDAVFEVERVYFLDERPFIEKILRVKPYGCYLVIRFWDQKAQESIEVNYMGWTPTDEDIVKGIQTYLESCKTSRAYRARINEISRYEPTPIFIGVP